MAEDVIVLNEFGVEKRKRRSTGKERITISIQSQPLLHEFSERRLGRKPAQAIRDVLAKKILGYNQNASAKTIQFRQRARTAFQRGARWAVRRYSGGRTKNPPPGQTQNLYHDSGRLGAGLFVAENPRIEAWTINVPSNRFNEETFESTGQLVRMITQMQDRIPELRNAALLMKERSVRRAINESISDMITRARLINNEKKAQLRRELFSLLTGGRTESLYRTVESFR